jgi:ABC-type branched-subunit amino acid transport system ATPase component
LTSALSSVATLASAMGCAGSIFRIVEPVAGILSLLHANLTEELAQWRKVYLTTIAIVEWP